MAGPALTPALALDYLDELSVDIGAAVVLDSEGGLAASWRADDDRGERVRELVVNLLARADQAPGGDGSRVPELEVTTPRGGVFCVRDGGWTIAVVSGRFVLPSLMRYDLRTVLTDLSREPE